jgi:hypothetical protein
MADGYSSVVLVMPLISFGFCAGSAGDGARSSGCVRSINANDEPAR